MISKNQTDFKNEIDFKNNKKIKKSKQFQKIKLIFRNHFDCIHVRTMPKLEPRMCSPARGHKCQII